MSAFWTALTFAFAQGWRALPNELKLEVLSHVLPYEKGLDVAILTEQARTRTHRNHRVPTDVPLMWFLLEHPEFSGPATEVFFKNNTILTKGEDMVPDLQRYPASCLSPHIKRVQISIYASDIDWRWLMSVVNGEHGFEAVKEAIVVICSDCSCDKWCGELKAQIRNSGVRTWDLAKLSVFYEDEDFDQASGDPEQLEEIKSLVEQHLLQARDL